MLKTRYTNKEDIPEQYIDLFTEQGGEWVLTGISGMKTQEDVDRVQEGLRKEREDHKKTKDKFRSFGDRDPEEILSELDKIEEYKLAAERGGMDDDKINQIVETRIRSRLAPVERERDNALRDLQEREQRIGEFETKERKRSIHDSVREAASKAKIRDTAITDALLIGEHVFEVNENGDVVTKDGVGVTPGVSPEVWLTETQSVRPHWWPESQGAGATGGKGGSGGVNPFSKDGWNMTEQGKLLREDRAKAEQMAKAAGTTIGGPRPQ